MSACRALGEGENPRPTSIKPKVTAPKVTAPTSNLLPQWILYRMVLVDDKHKLLFCTVPKAGNTSWKTMLKDASGHALAPSIGPHNDLALHHILGMPRLHLVDTEGQQRRLADPEYLRLIIVRHPFDRLISAYRDKIQLENFYPGERLDIKAAFAEAGRKNVRAISLEEFAKFLVEDKSNLTAKLQHHQDNYHWRPQVDVCFPCRIHYDYVMHLETMADDSSLILSRIPQKYRILPRLNPSKNANDARQMFDKLPEYLKKKLYKKYEEDFKVFGYTWENGKENPTKTTHEMCS